MYVLSNAFACSFSSHLARHRILHSESLQSRKERSIYERHLISRHLAGWLVKASWMIGKATLCGSLSIKTHRYCRYRESYWANSMTWVLHHISCYQARSERSPRVGATFSRRESKLHHGGNNALALHRACWGLWLAITSYRASFPMVSSPIVYVRWALIRHTGSKQAALEMVHNIIHTFDESITSLEWMDAETKANAISKLKKITNKIGSFLRCSFVVPPSFAKW